MSGWRPGDRIRIKPDTVSAYHGKVGVVHATAADAYEFWITVKFIRENGRPDYLSYAEQEVEKP